MQENALLSKSPESVALSAARSRELSLLHRISEVLGYDLSLSELLRFVVGVTADLMESKIVSVLLYDEESRSL
ncbi:MAG: hypothetical protein V4498_01105, partial [candidate division FCPU426 bacterium]